MAFHLQLRDTFWVGIDQAVGRRKDGILAINRRDDVMLVQWLLVKCLTAQDVLGPASLPDGIYGPKTDYHLCRFLINNYFLITKEHKPEDTIIEPLRVEGGVVRNQGGPLSSLNFVAFGSAGRKQDDFPRWLEQLPLLLQKSLKRNFWDGNGPKPNFPI